VDKGKLKRSILGTWLVLLFYAFYTPKYCTASPFIPKKFYHQEFNPGKTPLAVILLITASLVMLSYSGSQRSVTGFAYNSK